MMRGPRAVFGLPAYRRIDTLARTLESLLTQTCRDLAIVIVDDGASRQLREVVASYAALDARISYESNPVRLGMVANWRKAFELGRRRFPGSEYFAWASDHDVWHPRWLEVLVSVLDADSRVVLAYPHGVRLYANGRRRIEGTFDTAGIAGRLPRLRRAATGVTAGNAIYGLFRAAALEQAGVFRPVLLPDRQVLLQLSLLGEFRQAPELLWYRDASRTFSRGRQRAMLFSRAAPLHTYLPVDLQHAGVLLLDLAWRGRGRPAFGRWKGAGYACALLWYALRSRLNRRHTWRRAARGRRLDGGRPAPAAATAWFCS